MGPAEEVAEKIRRMEIRGAGRIGRAVAGALRDEALVYSGPASGFREHMFRAAALLLDTRPTAVSLRNALRYVLMRMVDGNLEEMRESVVRAAEEFIRVSKEAVERIGRIGSGRIPKESVVMTHCNSQAAISVILHAWDQGRVEMVINTETRPAFQGHITARTLASKGVPVTMIIDSAVRYFMKEVDVVVVGADTVASNGAVINKIGTSQIALAANEARVPFLVAAETYKFSPETMIGKLVEIEERDPREVANPEDFPGVRIRNPVFDATPPEYIDAIVTEMGVISPHMAYDIIKELFGSMHQDPLAMVQKYMKY